MDKFEHTSESKTNFTYELRVITENEKPVLVGYYIINYINDKEKETSKQQS